MTIEQALALLAAVGSDSAPKLDELTAAKNTIVEAAKLAKSNGDKEALASMLEGIKLVNLAIEEAEQAAAKEAEELDALTADIPELAAEVEETAPAASSDAAPVAKVLSLAEAAHRLGLTGAGDQIQVSEQAEPTQTLTINGEEASDAGWAEIGQAFSKATRATQRAGRSTIATLRTEYSNNLTSKADENSRLIDQISQAATDPAIVAAGGCCTLAEPIRDQPMLASLVRPIAAALPTIGATVGAVTMYPPICLPQDGVNTWSCTQDEAVDPEDEETWKECTEIECDDAETVTVEAIYRCLTIGNFQHRFSPERWNSILHATMAMQARMSEVALFNKIAASPYTTTHTVTDTGSIYATFLQNVLLAAATIRQNQRYEGARIKVIAPAWLQEAIAADRIARAVVRGRQVDGSSVETMLGERNIDVTWSPDLGPIEPNGQASGPLTQYPATAQIVMHVDGGVFRLDGGEINLGTEIRDHDLNRQNKVAAFSEQFETALVRACDTKAITLPVTVCASAPCAVEAPEPGDDDEIPEG